MVSSKLFTIFAALAAVACAAPRPRSPCKPTPTLPLTGGIRELTGLGPSAKLKKIVVGHGIQNYTCESPQATPAAIGALAVLYDVTPLYPGTRNTGVSQEQFNALTSTIMWEKHVPLNLVANTGYNAQAVNPFPAPADLELGGALPPLKFVGHHYFDSEKLPMFDLSAIGLAANVAKNDSVDAPPTADSGTMGTGAVTWLKLHEAGKGRSVGLNWVYRVITAGGVGESCEVIEPGTVGSVPYTAFYWLYEL